MKKVMAILCFTMAGSAISADQPEKMTIEVSGAETPKQLSFWDKLKGFFSGKKESPKKDESGSAGQNNTSGTNENKSGSDDAMFSLEPSKTDNSGSSQEKTEEGIPVFEGLPTKSGTEDKAEQKDNMKKKDKKDKKEKKGKKKNKDEEE